MVNTIILVLEVSIFALAINLPFGHWRAPTKKFSVAWFAYIHLPIPAIFVLRRLSGLDYTAIPVIIAGAVIGQIIGARLNRKAQMLRKARMGLPEDA